jgi:predicted ATPase
LRFSLDPGVNSSSRASWALWLRGYPARALEQSNRTLLLAREINHAHSLGLALSFAAMLHQFRGEPQAAHAIAQEAVVHCAEHRLSQFAATSRFVLGWAIARRGQPADGIRLMQDSLDGYRQIGATMYLSWFLGVLAQALAARGDVAEGLAIILEGVERVHTNHNHPFPPELHRLKGEFLLLERRQPEAEHSFVTALGLMRQRGAKMLELRTSANLARLWRDQGRHGEARDLLAPIYGWFTEGFDTPDLKEAKALLVELGQGAGPVSAA